jgi:hypothetical protein
MAYSLFPRRRQKNFRHRQNRHCRQQPLIRRRRPFHRLR